MRAIIYVLGMCAGALLMWIADAAFKKKEDKRWGKTDKLYLYNVIFVTVTVVASFMTMIFSGMLGITDLSPISVIVPSAFGELAIHTGFIIWKAKQENCRKYKDVNMIKSTEEEEFL